MKNIYADGCFIKKINNDDCQELIKENDKFKELESNIKEFSLGLFFDDELIQAVRFCAPFDPAFKKKYDAEIYQMYMKEGYRIIGGVKLFTDFYKTKHYIAGIIVNGDVIEAHINEFIDYGFKPVDEQAHEKNFYEWVNTDLTFYTYKITASDSDKYYIGVSHVKINNAEIEDCLNDNYFGSGGVNNKNNKFVNWKNKHKKKITKTVLGVFDRKYKAYDEEKKLIGDLWQTDELCLNSRNGGNCVSTIYNKNAGFLIDHCLAHGFVNHKGGSCCKCNALSGVSMKNCPTHGLTKFRGDFCYKCLAKRSLNESECSIHGITTFRGASCLKCVNKNSTKIKKCETHGETIFLGDTCLKCVNSENISKKECLVHGLTKHRGNSCSKCNIEGQFQMKECGEHGLTKHHGSICVQCRNKSFIKIKKCSKHGMSKHIGRSCCSCTAEKNTNMKYCEKHGRVKHIGAKCYSCTNTPLMKECSKHGLSRHRKDGFCIKCKNKKSAFKKKVCTLCSEIFSPKNGKQRVCSKNHYVLCPECDEEMLWPKEKFGSAIVEMERSC